MSALGGGKANELTIQNDMPKHLVAKGWLLGKTENFNRAIALYTEDLLGFVKETQDEQWQKFRVLSPSHPEQHFLERVTSPLEKTDPNSSSAMRAFCTAPAVGRCEPAKALAA